MKAAIRLTVLLFLTSTAAGAAQQRAMDHDVWEMWRRVQGTQISDNGQWVLYRLTVANGDAVLKVSSADGTTEHTIPRGSGPEFSADSRFVAFLISPEDSIVKARRMAKTPAREMPRDSLGILDLRSGTITRVARVKSFAVPEDEGNWIAYLHHEPLAADDDAEDESGNGDGDDKEPGTEFVLRNLETGESTSMAHVSSFALADNAEHVAWAVSTPDGMGDGVFVAHPGSDTGAPVLEGQGNYLSLTFSMSGNDLAFLTDRDDYDADEPNHTLYHWNDGSGIRAVAMAGSSGIPGGWVVSQHGDLSYSDSGERLFFGTAPAPLPEPEELPEWERVELDIWNWRDPLLQPMQLVQRSRELERTYRAVAHVTDGDRIVQLATEAMPNVTVAMDGDGDVAFSASNMPYRKEVSWDSPRYVDLWIIDVNTGNRRRVMEALQATPYLSPDGNFVAWWDGNAKEWMAMSTDAAEPVTMSSRVAVPLDNELHDWPYITGSYGRAGWTDDGRFLVYDKHDIWALDPAGQRAPVNVTDGVGRRENIRFRYLRANPDEDVISTSSDMYLSALHLGTKDGGIYTDRIDRNSAPRRLAMSAHRYGGVRKAAEASRFVFTRESFREFPDVRVTDASFANDTRISDANPQQADYRWGSAELVDWRANDGRPHRGLLFKPDGFDPNREYPMMVYFYEKNSDGLNNYRGPFLGGSSINVSFYVSRGYVVFVPDVHYRVGYPGESALNSVVSGVLSILEDGYVDPARVGVQGHSWGGYQIAYMVTKTHVFAAAEAGAPVANMTSAYGGIRWASGMNRAFQYEKTQSRIGATLWERRDRYIENSPLFWADNVQTPVLMMHNDEDGAVPWYQGIEYFAALRRLDKPVWMLNYNGEAHGLRKHQNRMDWQVRMQQFFDHYLLGTRPAVWMVEGVPAVAKGRDLGLELVAPSEPTGSGNGNRN